MAALSEAVGDSLNINSAALEKGILIVEFDWPMSGELIPLRAYYPDSFPRLRPLVNLRVGTNQFPPKHCSPLDGNLCLLGRESRQWPNQWTLAKLLHKQLAGALKGGTDEDPQGEPAEFWWNISGIRNSYVLIDSNWALDGSVTSGKLKLKYSVSRNGQTPEIRAIVSEVLDTNDNKLCQWSSRVPLTVVSPNELIIPWAYIDEFLLPNRSKEQFEYFVARLPKPPSLEEFSSIPGKIFAILHKSELGFNKTGLGWIFFLSHGPRKSFRSAKPGEKASAPQVNTIPTFRAGTTDIGARVPSTGTLIGKKIIVVGLGAIGAPTAIELARNGCSEIHLVDRDNVEPGNSIRWSLGASAWGRPKVDALATFIRGEYPWTKVEAHPHHIGLQSDDLKSGDELFFQDILPSAHLIVDASASYGVTTILSDYSREANIPLVSFYASPPVTGGVVAAFQPHSGCPTCLEIAYDIEQLSRAAGFGSEEGLQQPPGCSERTFSGASYDLQELSLQATRLINETLRENNIETVSKIYTLSLPGGFEPPAWRVDTLTKVEGCSCNPQ